MFNVGSGNEVSCIYLLGSFLKLVYLIVAMVVNDVNIKIMSIAQVGLMRKKTAKQDLDFTYQIINR